MNSRTDLLYAIFDHVKRRLSERADSLCLFIEHWHGSNGGIEGWFKVEFVAAVPPHLAIIRTGSAYSLMATRRRFPDLRLERTGEVPLEIELKASTNWSPHHGKGFEHYRGFALFFLCGAPADSLDAKRSYLATNGVPFELTRVCAAVPCHDKRAIDFLFGFVDLRGVTRAV